MPAPKSVAILDARVMGIEHTITPERPAEVIYDQGFERTPDSWVSGPGSGFVDYLTQVGPGSSSGGAINFWRDPVYDYGLASISNTISGLTIGQEYTFSASMKLYNADAVAVGTLGVVGIGASSAVILRSSGWATLRYTFVATATSHAIVMTAQDSTGAGDTGSDAFADGMKVVKVSDGSVVYRWARSFQGVSFGTTTPRSGSRSAIFTAGGASGSVVVAGLNGLTIGWSYTARIWVRRSSGSGSVSFGTAPTTPTSISTTYQERSFTFTAAATTASLVLSYTTAGSYVMDDFTLTRNTIAAVTEPNLPLDLVDAQVTLDDSRNPYVEGRLTVHVPATEYLEQIDPRDGLRVKLDALLSWDEPVGRDLQTRSYDLLLHERVVDQEAGTLALVLESDEALLIDGGHLGSTADTSAYTYDGDVNAIVSAMLASYGFTLEPGAAVGRVTTNRTNLVVNPTATHNATGWKADSGATVASRQTGSIPGTVATTYFRTTPPNGNSGGAFNASGEIAGATAVNVSGSTVYTVVMWVRSSVAKTMYLAVEQVNAAGTNLGSATGTPVVLAANTWTRLSLTITTVPTAARAGIYCYLSTGTWNGSQTFDFGAVTLTAGTDPVRYFDGSTSDAFYTYAWTGTAGASTSTRVGLSGNASSDVFKQDPGVSDWDFLDGVLRPSGLRLFCDEQRDWRLIDPATYLVDGTVSVSEGINATKGTDSISLQATRQDGSPVWYSGVVVRYVWTDSLGATQERFDYAGTAQKVWRVTINRPYPGTGRAAAILALAQGRGRTQELEALADLNATPGMTLVSTLPVTPIQVGTVSAVTWFWAADGDRHDLMAIRSRGLVDTPETAWLFQPDGYAWNEIPVGQDWTEYVTP